MSGDGRAVYFEHHVLGRQVRVTAICSKTGVEVSILGPAGASSAALEELAMRRLMTRLGLGGGRPAGAKPGGGGPSSGSGRLV